MALAAIDLQRIVLAVEVVDAADLPRLDFPGIRVPEVPAAAVIADDQLVTPGLPAVFAHSGANAEIPGAVPIDHDEPVVAHPNQAARGPEVVDAREEAPGAPTIVALVHLGPHVPGRIALAAERAQDATIAQECAARIEPAMTAEREAAGFLKALRRLERIALGRDVAHEAELGAAIQAAIDQRAPIPVRRNFEHEQQTASVRPHEIRVQRGQ